MVAVFCEVTTNTELANAEPWLPGGNRGHFVTLWSIRNLVSCAFLLKGISLHTPWWFRTVKLRAKSPACTGLSAARVFSAGRITALCSVYFKKGNHQQKAQKWHKRGTKQTKEEPKKAVREHDEVLFKLPNVSCCLGQGPGRLLIAGGGELCK